MDIKNQLKEAREAIKKKDFNESIRICRNVLNEDHNNYIALVFLGLSLQETSQPEESEKLFRRATEVDPHNLLAWNGLVNYFEKIDSKEAKQELIKLYSFLIEKETAEKKFIEYSEKLCALNSYTNIEEICRLIYDIVMSRSYSETSLLHTRLSLANILKKNNELSDDILNVYEDILRNIINNKETVTADYYSEYLMVLYKLGNYESLFDHVIEMYKMYQKDVKSIQWICRLYNELYVEKRKSILSEFVNIEEISDFLSVIDPGNVIGMFTKSILDVEAKEFNDARNKLEKVVSMKSNLLHAWILLTKVNILLHYYNDALETVQFASKIICSSKDALNQTLSIELEIMRLEALSRSTEISYWKETIELYDKFDGKLKEFCLPHYTRANIKLGNIGEAKRCITQIEKRDYEQKGLSTILKAQMLREQNDHILALDVLNNELDKNPEWFLEVGINHLELKEFDKCVLPLLKAIRKDPNNFYCFYYLGKYHCAIKQYEKGKRCYEKSYKLCPTFGQTAMELSKIYRLLKNWDANIALLQTITKDVITKQNIWAWLQMGLNFMEQGDYGNAVQHLRLVSRVDEENAYCWEALADAYLYNGAYTSALRAYERVLEISNDALYPALQIAYIKKDLGHYQEAMSDFEALLSKDKNCILTLTGLAETCYKRAVECVFDQRLGTARDCAQYGVEAISRAIQQRSELSCLWKILGDCCMLIAELPVKYCCLMVMKAIFDQNQDEGNTILEKEELLQLAIACYCKAIVLTENNYLLWHDLAVAFVRQAKGSDDERVINTNLTKAQSILHQCTEKNSSYWQHWNLLGIVFMRRDPPNFAQAQHAFIKAVTIDRNSAVAWTNLGVLYLKLGNILLANQAFGQAQRSDPNYIQSWIGQGLLAEIVDQEDEAMDLFRHSTDLGFHSQGALGYGHWVCKKLIGCPSNANPYVIEKLHAIPVACDALTWYIQSNTYDSCAWNMLGIFRERMGLLEGAAEAFEKAVKFSTEKYSDLARINFVRVLCRLRQYKEAIRICNDLQENSFESGIWYALALYKDNQFQEASSIYLAIIQYLAKESAIGDVIACMAILTYGLGEPDLARKAIAESFNERPPTARVMYALTALGVLQDDTSLMLMALKQVELLDDLPQSIEDFISLISHVHIYQGNYTKAIRKTCKQIHSLPGNPDLWLTLALTLLYSIKNKKCPSSYSRNANNAANIALKLRTSKSSPENVSKILCTISASAVLVEDNKSALIAAQKAVFCTPNVKECWIVLNDSLKHFSHKREYYEMSNDVLYSSCDDFNHIRANTIF